MDKKQIGFLILNLGSPRSSAPSDVSVYLKQFLMDPDIISIPFPIRWVLVHLLIVPKRSQTSAKLYEKIWTDEGSPLVVYSANLMEKIKEKLDQNQIELAMRYGSPSIKDGMERLIARGVKKIVLFPQYPQFADATIGTTLKECKRIHSKLAPEIELETITEFYNSPSYIKTVSHIAEEHLNKLAPDHLLFSFHGLPVSHLRQASKKGTCLNTENCCEKFQKENPKCYKAQCLDSAKLILESLSWPQEKSSVSFQSRLGRTEWIQPYTSTTVENLAKKGIKKLAVICPGFTADCLETLEEIAIGAEEIFKEAGGEELHLIPAINDHELWVDSAIELMESWGRQPV